MAYLGGAGFDKQNSTADLVSDAATTTRAWQWSRTGACLISAGTNFYNFGKCLQFNPTTGSGGASYSQLTLSSSLATGITGFNIYLPSGTIWGMAFYDSALQDPLASIPGKAVASQVGIILDTSNGRITAYRNLIPSTNTFSGTSIGVSSNNTFSNNSSLFLEIQPTINSSTGAVVVKINGTTVLSLSNVNTQQDANATYDSILFFGPGGPTSGAGGQEIDNLVILNTTGSAPFNTFLSAGGIPRIYSRFPTANSSVTWTPLANTNWQEVSETAMDGDTSYNFSNVTNNTDLFTMQPLPANSVPLALQPSIAVRQDSAGSLAAQTALKSGSAAQANGESLVGNATYVYQCDILTTDPNTGIAWTLAGANAATEGYNESV